MSGLKMKYYTIKASSNLSTGLADTLFTFSIGMLLPLGFILLRFLCRP